MTGSANRASHPPTDEEYDELRGVYLSRLMFNPFVGWAPETRTFEEYVEAVRESRTTT